MLRSVPRPPDDGYEDRLVARDPPDTSHDTKPVVSTKPPPATSGGKAAGVRGPLTLQTEAERPLRANPHPETGRTPANMAGDPAWAGYLAPSARSAAGTSRSPHSRA